MTYAESIGVYLVRAVANLFPRPNLGRFLRLENIKHKIRTAAKRKEDTFPDLVTSYVSAAFFIPKRILDNLRWEYVFLLFSLASRKSVPTIDIPLLRLHSAKDDKKEFWDYDERPYHLYVHMLAKSYGWDKKKIDNLDVDVALALIQEIITDEQLDREFLWAMSDKSYSYDYKTKSGKPNPLERPYFMKEEVKPPPKMQIPKAMMPQGNVNYGAISEAYQPKKIDAIRGL